jgi:hypothetical protein
MQKKFLRKWSNPTPTKEGYAHGVRGFNIDCSSISVDAISSIEKCAVCYSPEYWWENGGCPNRGRYVS